MVGVMFTLLMSNFRELKMTTKNQEMQNIIRLYKEDTGETEIDMRKVAEYAVNRRGMPLPEPVDRLDMLAKKFSQAAREETRIDQVTGRPYRANHALTQSYGGHQYTLWIDIDEAPRKSMVKSLMKRRDL